MAGVGREYAFRPVAEVEGGLSGAPPRRVVMAPAEASENPPLQIRIGFELQAGADRTGRKSRHRGGGGSRRGGRRSEAWIAEREPAAPLHEA
jgi:hypothetical protein